MKQSSVIFTSYNLSHPLSCNVAELGVGGTVGVIQMSHLGLSCPHCLVLFTLISVGLWTD